jgi:ribosomal-protein-alanine N-acetyltransferase
VIERLIIREITHGDLDEVYEYNKNPEIFKYMPFGPSTYENAKKRIERLLDKQNQDPRTDFDVAITLKTSGKLIGGCRLNKVSDIEGHIGYILSKDQRGNGYATEAAKALTDYGFNELNLHRVYATVHPENAASIRVLEKVGMTLEGRLRENMLYDGEYGDSLIYSILEQEWKPNNP